MKGADMDDHKRSKHSIIGAGAYSLRDAALLLHVPYVKLRRWAVGYWFSAADEDRFSEPVVAGGSDEIEERILTFHELIELAVVAFFRGEGVTMNVVRAARLKAQELFGTPFPFATQRLKTDGRGIFSDLAAIDDVAPGRVQLELSKSQITYNDLVEPFFRIKLDFSEDGLASTYWPMGRDKPILLAAQRSFGRPIIQSSGTPTFILYQMRESGEAADRIAAWYKISRSELDAALEYESSLRAVA